MNLATDSEWSMLVTKVASRVKMCCFIIFSSVCINVFFKLQAFAMFLSDCV
jgi:hypothetical protein